MIKYFKLENLKKEIQKRIDKKEDFIKEWEKVSFNYKKDGSEYQSIKKSINNAYYRDDYHLPELYIYSKKYGYEEDIIYVYNYYKDIENKEDYKIIDYTWKGEPYKVIMKVKEMEEEVKKHIQKRKEEIKKLKQILNNLENEEAIKLIEALKEELNELYKSNSTLYYLLSNALRK